ncbi:MAG: exopolyphosphatase [Moraxellaceae bacterium]|nr:exopolyphosphatase [Pseudomonadales bacterium]MCB1673889.1 exopolyphosphatase [Pseudomonadales bacterium]MCP5173784.1 exopolyphosphatase [Moraxellaceae bacterium]MCP5176897.1 exopolyphosphatase [Moraxellaceae bacterium]HQV21488.1 exopolyphosphatase [Agitococcus sp.]
MNQHLSDGSLLAAIDLGSNSFHLAIARLDHGEVRRIDSLSDKVQLGAGFDKDNNLSAEAQERALACLARFAQRLQAIPLKRLRIVATNALRQANNASLFIEQAERILKKRIEIVAGREEARLIYLGVSQTLADAGRRLVVDIGGGSTEFIIGENFEPLATESLQMGCVAYTQRFFADGSISAKALNKAIMAARQEVMVLSNAYKSLGWQSVVGSSGTIKAARQIMLQNGWSNSEGLITREGLQQVRDKILSYKHVSELQIAGLKDDRRAILPAGFAIIQAVFDELELQTMTYSDGALREGVLHDMLGRLSHEDIRDRSANALMARYHVDTSQAQRVAQTAELFFQQTQTILNLDDEDQDLLRRAALLHEIGLAISHSSYHKHGAYLLQYSDVAGFSQADQEKLSLLVTCHRRKIRAEQKLQLIKSGGLSLFYCAVLLRLAALVHHSRSPIPLPELKLSSDGSHFILQFPQDWLINHPLTSADLEGEKEYLSSWDIQLLVS